MLLKNRNGVLPLGSAHRTIAIIGGRICIGLTPEQLELLGNSPEALKVSRRDLAYVLSQHKLGATTVAATMICAQLAGISVFVTGGIGGVHRGAETSFDISADLQELARTSVAVVCAGVKSILDIGLTLEYLETQGVPVVSVGQPGFPAFFTRESGFHADFQLDTAADQAAFIHTKWRLGLNGGVVVSNPVPEADAMQKEEIDAITLQALQEAAENGVTGKKVTPFLLARIKNERNSVAAEVHCLAVAYGWSHRRSLPAVRDQVALEAVEATRPRVVHVVLQPAAEHLVARGVGATGQHRTAERLQ